MVGVNVPVAVLAVKSISVASKPVTGSLNVTVKFMGEVAVGSVCAVAWLMVTVGTIPSITIALFSPNELVAAGIGNVKTASAVAAFLIVPPLRDKAVVER